jgi:hypothetical protein
MESTAPAAVGNQLSAPMEVTDEFTVLDAPIATVTAPATLGGFGGPPHSGPRVSFPGSDVEHNLPMVFPFRRPDVTRAFGHAEHHLFPADENVAVKAQPRVGMKDRERRAHRMLRGPIHTLGPDAEEPVAS